jgi:predicted nucleotidyltransferase
MKAPPLSAAEVELICSVFRQHPEVSAVKLFGSRAKGTHQPHSDLDLALWGDLDPLGVEVIAAELDELPLPYRYDARLFESIKLEPLREHIERVGVPLYPPPRSGAPAEP